MGLDPTSGMFVESGVPLGLAPKDLPCVLLHVFFFLSVVGQDGENF